MKVGLNQGFAWILRLGQNMSYDSIYRSDWIAALSITSVNLSYSAKAHWNQCAPIIHEQNYFISAI